MRAARLAGIVILGLLVVGCRGKKAEVGPPPQTPLEAAQAEAQKLREAYRSIDSNARVGVVMAVRPAANLAAVGDVPLADFRVGEALSFIDASQQTLSMGTVTQIDTVSNVLIVKYEAQADGRAPREGDLAVRIQVQ